MNGSSEKSRLRALIGGAATVLIFAGVVRLLVIAHSSPATMWDTGSYVDYARQMIRTGSLPHLQARTPGYPAFLILVGRPFFDAASVVRWQQAIGVAGDGLAFGLAFLMTGSLAAALTSGIGCALLFDLLLMENCIYTETLAGFLILASAAGLAFASRRRGRPALGAAILASFAAGLSPLVRPVLFVLLPIAAVFLVRITRGRVLAAALACLLLPSLAIIGIHAVRDRRASLSTSFGPEILNFVGFPEFYLRLPPDLAPYRDFYLHAAPHALLAAPRAVRHIVPYWESLDGLIALDRSRGIVYRTPEDAATSIALRCIRATPRGYAAVWWDTAQRFVRRYLVMYGVYRTAGDWESGVPQFSGWRWDAIRGAERFGAVALPWIWLAGFLGPPILLATRSRRRPEMGGGGLVLGIPWAFAVAVSIASISLAPVPGEIRYRMPVESLLVVLAVGSAAAAARRLRHPGARSSGEEAASVAGANPSRGTV